MQRKIPTTPEDEAARTADIVELARRYGRKPVIKQNESAILRLNLGKDFAIRKPKIDVQNAFNPFRNA